MLQLTSSTANASSSSCDVLQLQQGCINDSHSQLQALLGKLQGNPTDSDLSVALTSLHNNGTMLQLLPQASSPIAMPLVLQMPGPADLGMHMLPGGTTLSAGMQLVDTSLTNNLQPGCMPQGYLQASGQQMVLVDKTPQLAACAGTGDSNSVQAQMQQLRAAVQQLNSQTAAVQQLLLSTQAGASQGPIPAAVASNMQATNAGAPLVLAQPSVFNRAGQQCMPQCVCIPSGHSNMLSASGQRGMMCPSGQRVAYAPGQPMVVDGSGQVVLPPMPGSTNLPQSCVQGNSSSSSCAMDVSRSTSSASSLSTSSAFGLSNGNVPSPGTSNSSGSNQRLPDVGSPAAPASMTGARTSGQLQILSAPAMPQPSRGASSCAQQGLGAAGMRLDRDMSAGNVFASRPMAARAPTAGLTRTAPGPGSRALPTSNPPPGTHGAAGFRPPAAAQGAPAAMSCPRGSPAAVRWPAATPAAVLNYNYLGKYASVPLMAGLQQLWSREQLHSAAGGTMFNMQQFAWQPVGDPNVTGPDMYDFSKLKRVVQKLDAVHKYRVKLIKRIHGVAEYGHGDLKLVYQEVRSLIGEVLRESAIHTKSIDGSGVGGLVRLALLLQEALLQGRQ